MQPCPGQMGSSRCLLHLETKDYKIFHQNQVHRRDRLQSDIARPVNTRDSQMVIGKHKNIRNKNKCHSTPSEPCSLTTASRRYTNKPTKQDSDLKPHLINIREDFKKDTNNSLKELQEEKGKQIEALKKETHTSFKEI